MRSRVGDEGTELARSRSRIARTDSTQLTVKARSLSNPRYKNSATSAPLRESTYTLPATPELTTRRLTVKSTIFASMQAEQLPSFPEIYETYKNKVFNTVLGYLQNTEDAEETTQDVFVEIHRSLKSFEGKSSLSTWIYRIAVNKSLDFIKSRNRKKRFAFLSSLFDEKGAVKHEQPDFHHPGVQLEQKENAALLFKTIHELPENQRTAFILSKLEGLGYAEIAEVMQLSVSSVESLLFRAKQNLQKKLSGYFNNERKF
ncbi:MAG: polymerase, sigma-24 subunit, subfamily [Bacteroidetes bacterium]|nr:polymerase, sigma-24 subunit, subfamily [Bacteroidota bacterium]